MPFKDTLIPEEEALSSLTYWYPILLPTGIPMPKTDFVWVGPKIGEAFDSATYERETESEIVVAAADATIKRAVDRIEEAGTRLAAPTGYPFFMKTGVLSDKHSWKDSCFVEKKEDIGSHLFHLIEASHLANIAGRPFDYSFIAVREMIKTAPAFTAFNGMPITKEIRLFIKDRKIQCWHPYWPREAFGGSIGDELLAKVRTFSDDEILKAKKIAAFVGRYFKDYWSVDVLFDADGNEWLIDMATGDRSWHDPKCEYVTIKEDPSPQVDNYP